MLRRGILVKVRIEEGESIGLLTDFPLRSRNGAHSLWTMRTRSGDLLIVLFEATLWIRLFLLLWAVPKYLGPVGMARVRFMAGPFYVILLDVINAKGRQWWMAGVCYG